MPKEEIKINPKILSWARINQGYSIQAVTYALKLKEADKVTNWESGKELPTFSQLLKLAKLYKRPSAIFFLSEIPKSEDIPTDYRIKNNNVENELSPENIFEIRQVRWKKDIAKNLLDLTGENINQFPISSDINTDKIKLAKQIRDFFEINQNDIFSIKSTNESWNYWRSKIENKNILTFLIPLGDTNSYRALSIYDDKTPAIIINSKDYDNGKIFSLLHEIGHLCLAKSGICNLVEPKKRSGKTNNIEVFCNSLAAHILLPNDIFLGFLKKNEIKNYDDEVLVHIAKKFRTSRLVVIRKLLDLKLILLNFYEKKQKQYEAEYKKWKEAELKKSKKSGGPSYYTTFLSKNGAKYIDLVFSALDNGRVSPYEASDYLGLKINNFSKLREKLIKKIMGSES